MKHKKKKSSHHKGIIRVSKRGIRYRKSATAKTGWVRVGKKKAAKHHKR